MSGIKGRAAETIFPHFRLAQARGSMNNDRSIAPHFDAAFRTRLLDLFSWRREDADIRLALHIDEAAGIVLESRTDEIAGLPRVIQASPIVRCGVEVDESLSHGERVTKERPRSVSE